MNKVVLTPPERLQAHYEVVIIGAGPAGLASAIELKKLGVKNIIVLERMAEAGGNPRHCGHSPFGLREFGRLYLGPGYVRKMLQTAASHGVRIALNSSVVSIAESGQLTLSTEDGMTRLQADKVVISTGIREMPRAPRLVSGQRPRGIMTTGALQSMVYLSQKKPFERPVIIGSELVAFSALASCRHAAITPVAMIESQQRLTAPSLLQVYPRLLGVEILRHCQLENIVGQQQVSAVDIVEATGQRRQLACDGVIFSGRFVPEAALPGMGHLVMDAHTQGPVVDQFGRCSDASYFATGNVLRPVETASWCWQEGIATARCVQRALAGKLPDAQQRITVSVASPEIKYVVPQLFSAPHARPEAVGMKHFQLRVRQPVTALIRIGTESEILYRSKINALPERRILLPMLRKPLRESFAAKLTLTLQ